MATKRMRRGRWEYRVTRKGVLSKPAYFTFDDEHEGDEYVRRLEALLDRGVVPAEMREPDGKPTDLLASAISRYKSANAITTEDSVLLRVMLKRLPDGVRLRDISFGWAQAVVTSMKRKHKLSPGTIRKYVGALARALDWLTAHGEMNANPMRMLPRGYSSYSPDDARIAGMERSSEERDRRLVGDEEQRIRAVLAGAKREDRERPLELRERESLVLLFDLALETAMRMREMFTIEVDQIDLKKRTIFLDKTKNGDKRQVPLSTVAVASLSPMLPATGRLFPWWDGDPDTLSKTTSLLSRQWARIFETARCEDLHFHDLRHEATSRIFERTSLDLVSISRITGHRDPRMLKRYANLRAENLAERMW